MPFISSLSANSLVLNGRVAGAEWVKGRGDTTPASDAPASGGFVV